MPLRILQIIQTPQRRGAEIFACQLSVELKNNGHHVDVVYLFDHDTFDLDFDLNFIPLKANMNRRLYDLPAYRRLNAIIRKGNYDIVQANASDTLKYSVFSRWLFHWTTPLIFRNASKMGDFMKTPFHRFLNRQLLSSCTYIISVSKFCRKDMISILPSAKKFSCTITIGTYDFSDIDVYQGQVEGRPVFINIGGLVPEKNQVFLVDIFHRILKDYPQSRLWMLGNGSLRKKVEQRIAHYGIEKEVVLWGNRPNVISLLKAADIMLMPSRIEGLPGVILEAMSCRIPVIAAPVGGIPEIVKDNQTGNTPPFDVEAYAGCVRHILEDEEYRMMITEKARRMVEKDFLIPKVANKFLKTYHQLIAHDRQ